jgi:hypothetical protein
VEMVLHEWVWMKELEICNNGIFRLVPRWDKCISVIGDYVENNNTSVE